MRCVFDTNVLISALLFPESKPARAFRLALETGVVYTSEECFEEFSSRFSKKKFEKYLTDEERRALPSLMKDQMEFVAVTKRTEKSRDKTDNKFLSVSEIANAE